MYICYTNYITSAQYIYICAFYISTPVLQIYIYICMYLNASVKYYIYICACSIYIYIVDYCSIYVKNRSTYCIYKITIGQQYVWMCIYIYIQARELRTKILISSYILLAMDIDKVGGLLSVVKLCTSMLCGK